jgi:hypothetical protein
MYTQHISRTFAVLEVFSDRKSVYLDFKGKLERAHKSPQRI